MGYVSCMISYTCVSLIEHKYWLLLKLYLAMAEHYLYDILIEVCKNILKDASWEQIFYLQNQIF